ncbi:Uncharacterized protein BM_BM371 [Brugia malayi]|uniref:Bm371 n=1 Tax=Brugia malayi TaxID=6279 RepID=A0A0K0JBH3_BRUMA|nr:Uncharacterized protein BM_BM371 [Brugia malayi]CDP93839.1 Bm371 [Brugia malayi]VIO97452.1 Uncharacterized protein BM_BM371 [Brugia malayi]
MGTLFLIEYHAEKGASSMLAMIFRTLRKKQNSKWHMNKENLDI